MLLIVGKTKRSGEELAEMFRYGGIIAYATDAHGAISEISMRYHGILVLHPEELPDPEEYIRRLKSYAAGIPIFSLIGEDDEPVFPELFNRTIVFRGIDDLFFYMDSYFVSHQLWQVGDYRLSGLDACCDLTYLKTVFGDKLYFTMTEMRILRYIMMAYPSCVPAKELVEHLFSPGKRPLPENIRSHISNINKRFHAEFPYVDIGCEKGKGYYINFKGAQ